MSLAQFAISFSILGPVDENIRKSFKICVFNSLLIVYKPMQLLGKFCFVRNAEKVHKNICINLYVVLVIRPPL